VSDDAVVERLRTLTFLPRGVAVRVPPGTTLFEAASWAGIAVDSSCGAHGTCHRCRVRVLGDGVPPTDADVRAFSAEELLAGWRLACRSAVAADGPAEIELEVPAPAAGMKTALAGRGRQVVLSPSLQLRCVALPPAGLDDQASDLERLARALPDLELEAPLSVVRGLPDTVGGGGHEVTAVVVGNRLVAVEPGDATGRGYGLAVDLGTTTVVAALVETGSGAVAALASAVNAQERFGSDVISRISHAAAGPQALEELREAAVATIGGLVTEVCAEAGIEPESIYHAVLAGNSTMLHLLLGADPSSLAVAPFTTVFRDRVDVAARELGLPIHPEARLQTFPLLGAYAGADTTAGILATGIGRGESTSLLVDIGTNGEAVLAAGGRIVATAAPAGPAFEGAEIGCGLQAVDGAIEAVTIDDGVTLRVLGGGEPRGICGSGLADAVAGLLAAGLLEPGGRLRRRDEVAGHSLADRLVEVDGAPAFRLAPGIELTQQDVRALQNAKAAISTAATVLMNELGVGPADLDEVLLAGSFGTFVDPASARAIGLIPPVSLDRVVPVGNTALEGAKLAVLSFREQQLARALARRVEYVELSARPDFNDTFVAALAFPAEVPA
jgi:uncharacterized 2Fe-2S/4Fe-4S cluster protein (DUF4445 family)